MIGQVGLFAIVVVWQIAYDYDSGNILLSLYPFTLYRFYNEFMSYFILKLVSCQ